jgi:hypothetical protein
MHSLAVATSSKSGRSSRQSVAKAPKKSGVDADLRVLAVPPHVACCFK